MIESMYSCESLFSLSHTNTQAHTTNQEKERERSNTNSNVWRERESNKHMLGINDVDKEKNQSHRETKE